MTRFLLTFLVLLLALFTLELTHPVQEAVVLPWTALLASISAWVISLFDHSVIAYGKILQHAGSGLGVSIEAGCNGIEACIILTAAVLAYPSSWHLRAAGLILGFLAIQIVNIGRIISLFYLAAWDHAIFEFAHLYLWQILIMVDVLIVWLVWIRHVAKAEEAHVRAA